VQYCRCLVYFRRVKRARRRPQRPCARALGPGRRRYWHRAARGCKCQCPPRQRCVAALFCSKVAPEVAAERMRVGVPHSHLLARLLTPLQLQPTGDSYSRSRTLRRSSRRHWQTSGATSTPSACRATATPPPHSCSPSSSSRCIRLPLFPRRHAAAAATLTLRLHQQALRSFPAPAPLPGPVLPVSQIVLSPGSEVGASPFCNLIPVQSAFANCASRPPPSDSRPPPDCAVVLVSGVIRGHRRGQSRGPHRCSSQEHHVLTLVTAVYFKPFSCSKVPPRHTRSSTLRRLTGQ
jgi:hypothetical protein